MNLREPPQASLGARKALCCLALLLLPAALQRNAFGGLGIRILIGSTPKPVDMASQPYLTCLGPPGLRFSAAPPQPEMAARALAAAPPLPHLSAVKTTMAAANAAAVQVAPAKATGEPKPADTNSDEPPPPSSASISILPDTVRPQVQAEDFLPYFVIPDAVKSTSTPPVPSVPGTLAPSTATYTETQK